MRTILQHLRMYFFLSLILGVLYPFWVTFFAEYTMKEKAGGSLLYTHGTCKGSRLIGQKFSHPSYFWSRPSFCDYNPLVEGASNLGPTSKKLQEDIRSRLFFLSDAHEIGDLSKIPKDLLFASGSGLDPHISLEAALFQVDRVAKARNFHDKEKLISLVKEHTEKKFLNFIGEDRVNVLELNLALEELKNE
jgi:potassium-transporting ATPase KdpC subunit